MRTQIGFKVTDNNVAVITPEQEMDSKFGEIQELTLERILQIKGYEQGYKILQEYFDQYAYPMLNQDQRDALFLEKLRKTKQRFFEPI